MKNFNKVLCFDTQKSGDKYIRESINTNLCTSCIERVLKDYTTTICTAHKTPVSMDSTQFIALTLK